jgi:hypothetical protein
MAGTLFGLPLSIQFDESGNRAAGGLLYIYEAGTSTPASTYTDFALSDVMTFPITLDAVGRVPAFYVDDGSYRARLTTSTGVELFDEQSITAIGASSSGGGGGGGSVSTETVFQTGDVLWLPINGTRTGWVRGNGRTISSGSGSGTERANSDTQALFEYFWNNFADAKCAVSGGRGANATADFNANKTIATLDMRNCAIYGMDTMGNSAAGTAGGSSTAADLVGASTVTIVTANLPSTNLSLASLTGTINTSITNGSSVARNFSENTDSFAGGGNNGVSNVSWSDANLSIASSVVTFGGSIPLGGSGTHLIIPPRSRAGTYYFKL